MKTLLLSESNSLTLMDFAKHQWIIMGNVLKRLTRSSGKGYLHPMRFPNRSFNKSRGGYNLGGIGSTDNAGDNNFLWSGMMISSSWALMANSIGGLGKKRRLR